MTFNESSTSIGLFNNCSLQTDCVIYRLYWDCLCPKKSLHIDFIDLKHIEQILRLWFFIDPPDRRKVSKFEGGGNITIETILLSVTFLLQNRHVHVK